MKGELSSPGIGLEHLKPVASREGADTTHVVVVHIVAGVTTHRSDYGKWDLGQIIRNRLKIEKLSCVFGHFLAV